MATLVVDASALAALLFGEPEGDAVAARLSDQTLVAPALMDFELANVCLTKLRRFPDQRDALLAGFALRTAMPIETVAIDHAETLALAQTTGLTAYDASYLWLTRRLGADLVTLDRRLERAAAELAG